MPKLNGKDLRFGHCQICGGLATLTGDPSTVCVECLTAGDCMNAGGLQAASGARWTKRSEAILRYMEAMKSRPYD